MLHNLYCVYSDTKNKEEINSAMVLTRITEQEEPNKVNKELKESGDNEENNQHFMQKMIIPSDLNDIQPITTQL